MSNSYLISETALFNPLLSVNSGQAFLWERRGENWFGVDGDAVIKISYREKAFTISYFPSSASGTLDYFRQSDNIQAIYSEISKDPYVMHLVQTYSGLRLLRQDPFQCLISFMCATNSSIQAIRNSLTKLCRRFGEHIRLDGMDLYTFPRPRALANASVQELRACGVGYRASFIQEASQAVANSWVVLEKLRRLPYKDAKGQLQSLNGIGNKVADCVLLFSLEKLDSFPIDVWIWRSLSSNYKSLFQLEEPSSPKLSPKKYEEICAKARSYFGVYAGYAQQFLYYSIRDHARRPW